MGKEKLFNEFPPISTQQWEDLIRKDLKGADYEKKLIWKTNEGIKVKPYYRAEDTEKLPWKNLFPGDFPFIRGNKTANNYWEINQDIEDREISQSNKIALDALAKGATSIGFIIKDKTLKKSDFDNLIKDISIDCINFNLYCNGNALGLIDFVLDHIKQHNLNSQIMNGSVLCDPLSILTKTGNWITNEESDFKEIKYLLDNAKANLPLYRVIGVNGGVFKDAGASVVHELAYTLSMASEYINRLTDMGLTIDELASRMQFNFDVSSNYFIEIAKIRAFRFLWSKLVEAYKPKNKNSAKAYIHSTTGKWNMTIYDPYVNVLRATTECMSAIIAGTDSLSVTPFDEPYKPSDNFSERIARNIQIVLKEEAYFDRVIDPAAGSYYIENLTDSLAEEAWKLFLKIENEEGYVSSLKKNIVQTEIETASNKRINDIATRRETLLGTNQYPNFNEIAMNCIETGIQENQAKPNSNSIIKPIKILRGAEAFEELRLRTEKSGKKPKVFMLTIGNLGMRLARSQFSSNFFALAGFEVIDNNGFVTTIEGVNAAMAAKADIIVLCSSDDEYATLAPEAYQMINNKAILVVAGSPICQAELETKGIKNFISTRSNILETLKFYQKQLKIN